MSLKSSLVSIEILPADPVDFIFKKNGICELDIEKMENRDWKPKPFFDHDLLTSPYIGIFELTHRDDLFTGDSARNSPTEIDLNTDEIIDSSEVGIKNKKFNLSRRK